MFLVNEWLWSAVAEILGHCGHSSSGGGTAAFRWEADVRHLATQNSQRAAQAQGGRAAYGCCRDDLITAAYRAAAAARLRRQNPDAWQQYAQEIGIALTNPAIGARYDLHGMLIAAASAGLGVAHVPQLYVGSELHNGRLVALGDRRNRS